MNTLRLPEQATLEQASALVAQVEHALAGLASSGSRVLHIDASGLAHFDSSLVATLLHARRLAAAQGHSVHLQGTPEKLRQLAQLYGVDALLPQA